MVGLKRYKPTNERSVRVPDIKSLDKDNLSNADIKKVCKFIIEKFGG